MPRIVTFNVNGLRSIVDSEHKGSMYKLLTVLKGDIICFQETKMVKEDLTEHLARVEGFDSYWSFCTAKKNYSGTATFVRSQFAPVAAEEGVTGCLMSAHGSNAAAGLIGHTTSVTNAFSPMDLKFIDSEGRCVITDHGDFVLFNLYVPASYDAAETERMDFKLNFLRALQLRVEELRAAGRNVIVTGDMNITYLAIDFAWADTALTSRQDRDWLVQRLAPRAEGGDGWVDVFRTFHPTREKAYSCWNTKMNCRVNNYGSRLDLILSANAAGGEGADPGPALDRDDGGAGPGPSSSSPAAAAASTPALKWTGSDLLTDVLGSDHCPVFADLDALTTYRPPSKPPILSALNKYTRKQASIKDLFANAANMPSPAKRPRLEEGTGQGSVGAGPGPSSAASPIKSSGAGAKVASPSGAKGAGAGRGKSGGKGTAGETQLQRSLFSMGFAKKMVPTESPAATEPAMEPDTGDVHCEPYASSLSAGAGPGAPISESVDRAPSASPAPPEPATMVSKDEAKEYWKMMGLGQQPSVPRCPGHNEPCAKRKAKQGDSKNKGRWFFACARGKSTPGDPNGQCKYFRWI